MPSVSQSSSGMDVARVRQCCSASCCSSRDPSGAFAPTAFHSRPICPALPCRGIFQHTTWSSLAPFLPPSPDFQERVAGDTKRPPVSWTKSVRSLSTCRRCCLFDSAYPCLSPPAFAFRSPPNRIIWFLESTMLLRRMSRTRRWRSRSLDVAWCMLIVRTFLPPCVTASTHSTRPRVMCRNLLVFPSVSHSNRCTDLKTLE